MDQEISHVADMKRLRECHDNARNALIRAGKKEFRRYEDAKWADFDEFPDGRMLASVQHDDLDGVTPEMIKWFFEHLGCCTNWDGQGFDGPEISVYHLWHNRDHVAVTPLTDGADGTKNLGFLEGASSRIHELTNEVNDVVYYEMETDVLNDHEFTFYVMKDGKRTGHVKHVYADNGHGGSTFYTETGVGLDDGSKQSALINHALVPKLYSKEQGMQWIRHNIQETGRLCDVAPVLYANQDKVYFDPEFTKFD
ncbi:MAG: hypothetical protein ACOYJL_02735 [Tractidigestivibacter sp.]|jgi:hypothetical protein|uniref:hypothetical protein n=1 Tax=Tractidigestivibacter sp. TaxID=2847320 RepID=UPI003D8B7B93